MKKLAEFLKGATADMLMHSDAFASEFTLRANPTSSTAITTDERDALLAKCAAGEYVELYIDYVAFEQRPGRMNRNFIRFADEMIAEFAASGVGSVFLIDHDQNSVRSRGGTVVASELKNVGKASRIMQTAKLTSPEFVAMALRGLIDRYSIGWSRTGDVNCSVCGLNIRSCDHYPGGVYDVPGAKNKRMTCEVIFTAAVLTESSGVNVPAVPETQGIGIRSAASVEPQTDGAEPSSKGKAMDKKFLKWLGLAEDATQEQVDQALAAREAADAEAQKAAAALAMANDRAAAAEKSALAATIEAAVLKADMLKAKIDGLIDDAITTGKLAAGGDAEAALRELCATNLPLAEKLIGALPRATLAGADEQTKKLTGSGSKLEVESHDVAKVIEGLAQRAGLSAHAYIVEVLSPLGVDSMKKLEAHAMTVLTLPPTVRIGGAPATGPAAESK